MSVIRDMPGIDGAINAESWEWLQSAWPELAGAVADEARRNTPARDVYRHVLQQVGWNREPLAQRCRQAMEHLQSNGSE